MFSALFDGVIRDDERFCVLRRQSLENKKIKAIPQAKFHMIHTQRERIMWHAPKTIRKTITNSRHYYVVYSTGVSVSISAKCDQHQMLSKFV